VTAGSGSASKHVRLSHSSPAFPGAIIPAVLHSLADCSVAVLLFNAATENLGIAHVRRPIEPGDLLALAHGPRLRVTVLVQLPGDGLSRRWPRSSRPRRVPSP
jgi:hypothetical protein